MLNIEEYETKTEEELFKKLKDSPENYIINASGEKSGLISKKQKYQVVKKADLINYINEVIEEMGILMGNPIKAEIEMMDDYLKLKINAENNAVIIGKDGRTLQAIQYMLMQILRKNLGKSVRIGVDVGNYKEEKQKSLERDIRFIADDVVATKVGVKLEYMNSYERRVVHSVINEYEMLESRSEGETPQRYVNIIYKERQS